MCIRDSLNEAAAVRNGGEHGDGDSEGGPTASMANHREAGQLLTPGVEEDPAEHEAGKSKSAEGVRGKRPVLRRVLGLRPRVTPAR